MSDQTELKFTKWPFYAACFLGDVILLACAYFLYTRHTGSSASVLEAALVVFCGTVGAALAVLPFVLEYQASVKMVETGALTTTVAQIQHLEEIAIRIGIATSQWQGVQEHSSRTTSAAKEIAERMTNETAVFTEFLQKANDTERATLRLEVEKLRRGEGDWLQVVVRILDHIYALNHAASRSGQQGLIDQLGQFQGACREIVRRIGLSPFVPPINDPFDPKFHTLPKTDTAVPADAKVGEVLACGFTFQGQLIRPALVTIQEPAPMIDTATAVPAKSEDTAGGIKPDSEEMEERTLL